jgi:hypothetical protein
MVLVAVLAIFAACSCAPRYVCCAERQSADVPKSLLSFLPLGPLRQPSLCNLDPSVLLPYERMHPVLPWRQVSDQYLEQQQQPQPHRQLLGDTELAARAVACVVGSALADAAAMGVHWVYDLAILDEIEQDRRQQVR